MKNASWKNIAFSVFGLWLLLIIGAVAIPDSPLQKFRAGLLSDFFCKVDGSFGFYTQDAADSIAATKAATNANTASTIVKRDSSGNFVAGTITGNVTGNAGTVTAANEASDTTCYPVFVTEATGNLGIKTNTSLKFNSSTGGYAFNPPTGGVAIGAATADSGAQLDVRFPAGSTKRYLAYLYDNTTDTANTKQAVGGEMRISATSARTATTIGLQFGVLGYNSTANISGEIIGVNSYAGARSGFNSPYVISSAKGVDSYISNGGTGTITSGYGIYIRSKEGAGPITNLYGLYLEPQVGAATLNYSIYSAGGQSYHAGNFGFGATAPTAKIHVAAGTATAGTAPLKLTSGTVLTTPEAGAIEYDGTNFYVTNSTPTRSAIGTMNNPMTTAEDLIVGGVSGAPARLAKGADGKVLMMVSGAVAWDTPAGGGDVVAPATTTENKVPFWSSVSKTLSDGWVTATTAIANTLVLRDANASITAVAFYADKFLQFPEISAPPSPAANSIRLYAKDSSGTTKIFTKDSAGTETELGAGGGTPSIVTITDPTYTITSADNGKLLTNAGATADTVWTFDTRANLGNAFEVGVVNEVGKSPTGGTITTSGNYTIHTFTTSGSFLSSKSINVEVLVVGGAGGAGGGLDSVRWSGGGGGGQVITNSSYAVVGGIPVTVIVGEGGTGYTFSGTAQDGTSSVFGTLTALHGNKGYDSSHGGASGSGNAGGTNGGGAPAGGGGGDGGVGGNATADQGGDGGIGTASTITGSSVSYGAGGVGGGGTYASKGGNGSTTESGANGIVIVRYLTSEFSPNSSVIALTPASGERLPNTSAVNRLLKSSVKNDYIKLRTTNTGIIAEGYAPASTNWVDTAP